MFFEHQIHGSYILGVYGSIGKSGLPPSRREVSKLILWRAKRYLRLCRHLSHCWTLPVSWKQPQTIQKCGCSGRTLFTKMVGGPDLACGSWVCQTLLWKANCIKFKYPIQGWLPQERSFICSCNTYFWCPTLLGKVLRLRAVVDTKDEANMNFVLKGLEKYLKNI